MPKNTTIDLHAALRVIEAATAACTYGADDLRRNGVISVRMPSSEATERELRHVAHDCLLLAREASDFASMLFSEAQRRETAAIMKAPK